MLITDINNHTYFVLLCAEAQSDILLVIFMNVMSTQVPSQCCDSSTLYSHVKHNSREGRKNKFKSVDMWYSSCTMKTTCKFMHITYILHILYIYFPTSVFFFIASIISKKSRDICRIDFDWSFGSIQNNGFTQHSSVFSVS